MAVGTTRTRRARTFTVRHAASPQPSGVRASSSDTLPRSGLNRGLVHLRAPAAGRGIDDRKHGTHRCRVVHVAWARRARHPQQRESPHALWSDARLCASDACRGRHEGPTSKKSTSVASSTRTAQAGTVRAARARAPNAVWPGGARGVLCPAMLWPPCARSSNSTPIPRSTYPRPRVLTFDRLSHGAEPRGVRQVLHSRVQGWPLRAAPPPTRLRRRRLRVENARRLFRGRAFN